MTRNTNQLLRTLVTVVALTLTLSGTSADAQQKSRQKLPSPEKIIGEYHKAAGGKKRIAAIRDAVYDWSAEQGAESAAGGAEQPPPAVTTARTQIKAPNSWRVDVVDASGEINRAASARSAWRRDANGDLHTLTDAEAFNAKLEAALEASNLINHKKLNALARTVALDTAPAGEPAYVVEFATREGARLRYWFGAQSKLMLRIEDARAGAQTSFGEYKARENGVLEPHRLTLRRGGPQSPAIVLRLREARYNTNLPDSIFEPPSDQAINIPQLLREVSVNQKALDERVSEYTYTRKGVEREINDSGEVKKEKIEVHEIYPIRGGGRVLKLISENNQPLTAERQAKEEKRVTEELEKAEREYQKAVEKREQIKRRSNETGAGKDGDEEFDGIAAFLRACEFVSPRREMFRDRETIVFDFRPRADFRPRSRTDSLLSKLIGVAWIDPADKQVMRLEARLADGFKIGGGLLASVRSGSAFAFEQARMGDGVWLPRFAQINASVKVFLVAGLRLDATREYSDYKRFNVETGDASVGVEKKQ